jgi:competence protein ComEC
LDRFQSHRLFWTQHPALLLGISLLIGCGSYLYAHPFLVSLPWFVYLLLISKRSLIFQGISFSLLGYVYSFALYSNAPHLTEPKEVEGIFSIDLLKPYQSPFQTGLLYKGTLKIPQALACTICAKGASRPLANQDYWVSGILEQRGDFDYSLKPKKWRPIEKSWRLAEWRYQLKEKFRKFLKKTTSLRTAILLSSLITGDIEDRSLRYEFSRVGLQHLLAISGFHFALLITFCSGFLHLFLPEKIKIWVLLILLTCYFLFVGSGPAVLRSFIMAFLYLIGKFLKRESSGTNLLGCAIFLEICLDPLSLTQIGFQLSFLSCGSILLLYPLIQAFIQTIFPKRTLSELANMTPLSPYGYLLSSFLRQSLGISIAVNIALLPLLLYHFHTFPLLSLFYNLFFPLGVSLSLFLLLCSLPIYLLWQPLGEILFSLTNFWTLQLLNLTSYPPLFLDRSIQISWMPSWGCIFYIFSIFFLTIHLKNNRISKDASPLTGFGTESQYR